MVTYLPTILMNMINQATCYIDTEDKYSLIITVNITCMMVLASVYLSVSASLPTTSDIKPVELWLLVNLAFPGLVILLQVILQVNIRAQLGCSNNGEVCRFWRKSLARNLLRELPRMLGESIGLNFFFRRRKRNPSQRRNL